jgi:septum formation protein
VVAFFSLIMTSLILASTSPRRRELLALSGWAFTLHPVDVVETPELGESPADFVQRMSRAKAQAAADELGPGSFVIGADTIVAFEDQIIGKPADAREALKILGQLRGRVHEVLTGLTVIDTTTHKSYTELVCSSVPMRVYSEAEIKAYVDSGDPLDKAGAYAIQHPEFQPVDRERFADCFANVMGLPLCHLLRRLRQLGLEPVGDLPGRCQTFLAYTCPVSEKILKEGQTSQV